MESKLLATREERDSSDPRKRLKPELQDLLLTSTRAEFLQKLHDKLQSGGDRVITDHTKVRWLRGTQPELSELLNGSEITAFQSLLRFFRNAGIIKVEQKQKHKYDRTNFYTIDYEMLNSLYKKYIESGVISKKRRDSNGKLRGQNLRDWRNEIESEENEFV